MNKYPRMAALALVFAVPSLAAAESLTLLAEDSFPANFVEAGELKGLSVDVLREAFERADVTFTMSVQPWARAYETALTSPGHCVFSAAHTPERDSSFRWIEPLNTIEMIVVAARDRPVSIKTREDLRRYTIGTYVGDYRENVLKEMQMHIESVRDDSLNAEKLRRGRIDLWATDSAKLPQLKGEFLPVYTYHKVDLALACNKAVDPATVGRLQQAIKTVHEAGTFARYRAKYVTQ